MVDPAARAFERGYRRGYRAAQLYVASLRIRSAADALVAPNELGYVLDRLYRRMGAARAHAGGHRDGASRNLRCQSARGEFFGFCAGLASRLR